MLKPKLGVITAVTRPQHLMKLIASFKSVTPYFDIQWLRVDDFEKKLTIGECWNKAVSRLDNPDSWLYILDDDNEFHSDFGRLMHKAIGNDTQLYLLHQYWADGLPRYTWNPEQRWGRIDAGQMFFRVELARKVPFQNRNDGPDGYFAQDLLSAGFCGKVVDVPSWYNYNAGR